MAVRMSRSRRLLGRFHLVVSALLAFLVWIALSALSTRPAFKFLVDLTPQAQFSISDESRELLSQLAERDLEVRVDTFYARLPQPRSAAEQHFVNIQRRIQELTSDLLLRYSELGGDRFVVRHYDLLGDVGATRARVEELGGLTQENVIVVSLGTRHKELQLSLDLAEIDFPSTRTQVAPGATQGLPRLELYKGEEAISTAIRSLLVEGTPRIYFLQGYGDAELSAGIADSYSALANALKADGFEFGLWNLEAEGRVPEDAAVLAVIEPRDEISPQAAEVLVRWLRQGGRLFLNLSWSEVSGPTWNPTWDELGRLAGFHVGVDRVCHLVPDPSRPESPGVGGPAAGTIVVQGLAAQHPITRPLANSGRYPQLKFAREVQDLGAETPEGVTFEPILRTGPWAWLAPRNPLTEGAVFDAPANRDAYAPRTVGAVIDVAADGGGRPGEIFVLGGMAFVNGGGFQRNGDLALNAFNWLAQRAELVTVRGNRYVSQRIELAPQQVDRVHVLVRWGVPGALLILGLVVLIVRRRG